jgi:hypothetical protein
LWQVCSEIAPRFALSAFTFCQPFLIASSVSYENDVAAVDLSVYGQALVGGLLLVYLGIAVRGLRTFHKAGANDVVADITGSVLALGIQNDCHSSIWSDCPDIPALD